jgi:hypothetical protein
LVCLPPNRLSGALTSLHIADHVYRTKRLIDGRREAPAICSK